MDKIKTASGRRLRQEGLRETTLPIPYDPAAMPGAVVLASNGRVYRSLRDGAAYQWREVIAATANGEVVLGAESPRQTFVVIPSSGFPYSTCTPRLQTEGDTHSTSSAAVVRTGNSNDPARFFIGRVRTISAVEGDPIGSLNFSGTDGYSDTLFPGISLTVTAEAGGSAGDAPMTLVFRTRPAGGGTSALLGRMRIKSDGKIKINTTLGTEQLAIAGSVELISATDKLVVAGAGVVGARKAGWTAPTGTATRSAFDTSTATATQLAERLKALIDDLISHGLIGA